VFRFNYSPIAKDRGVKSRAGADRHDFSGESGVIYPFIITGMLRWSPEQDFFVETDEGEKWLLDLPWLMTGEVDRLLHHRVAVEGGRTGRSTISVNSIAAR
jgi:hypothetical protein